jgi:hypothetical protein
MPGYEVRKMEEDFKKSDTNNDGKLSLKEFQSVRIYFCPNIYPVRSIRPLLIVYSYIPS